MSEAQNNIDQYIKPQRFEIRIKEHITSDWSDWFDGLTVTHTATRQTIFMGAIQDQSALHDLLSLTRDLVLTLISVRQIFPEHPVKENHRSEEDHDNLSLKEDEI